MKEVWIIKIATELDKKVLAPICADEENYAACAENESCYGGMYPKCHNVISYYVPKPHGWIIVPYKNRRADFNYGFYEFSSKIDLREWMHRNPKECKPFLDTHPEYFV